VTTIGAALVSGGIGGGFSSLFSLSLPVWDRVFMDMMSMEY
jgi:hypothetical protein